MDALIDMKKQGNVQPIYYIMAEEERDFDSLQNSEKDELIPNRPRISSSKSGWSFWLVYTAAVVVFGSSFQFGYGTSCINGPEKVMSYLGVPIMC